MTTSNNGHERSEDRVVTGADRRRVLVATTIGTTIEWYDFFIYAFAAALVFATQFFGPAGPEVATLLSFATIGISFLLRPVGAFLAGHFGDRIGRRSVLVWTLLLMGGSTTLVGLLPTYAAIGIAAPILLILLRVLQGISAGGEWGGAALMAVEHAPVGQRGRWGAAPQAGVPLGMLLASGTMALMAAVFPGQAFVEWGWRVPFLLSVVLIFVGFYVRRRVDESPVFSEIADRAERTKAPILVLLRRRFPLVIVAAFVFAGSNAIGQIATGGFLQNYATNPAGPALERGPVLAAVSAAAAVWLVFTWLSGGWSDRFGRKRVFLIGWLVQFVSVLALFPLVQTFGQAGLIAGLLLVGVAIGILYGPLSSLYAELFPASIRFSGVSITYAIGAVLGGAFAPTIAVALVGSGGGVWPVTVYMVVMTLLGFGATLLLRDRTGIPLGLEAVERQEERAFVGGRV